MLIHKDGITKTIKPAQFEEYSKMGWGSMQGSSGIEQKAINKGEGENKDGKKI